MILQLNPPIPLNHIEKGEFLAHFIHDDGVESEIMFTGIFNEDGQIWTFPNKVLRGQKNITLGRLAEDEKIEKKQIERSMLDRSKHSCQEGHFSCHYIYGLLTLSFSRGDTTVNLNVKFCPFCGYEEL